MSNPKQDKVRKMMPQAVENVKGPDKDPNVKVISPQQNPPKTNLQTLFVVGLFGDNACRQLLVPPKAVKAISAILEMYEQVEVIDVPISGFAFMPKKIEGNE